MIRIPNIFMFSFCLSFRFVSYESLDDANSAIDVFDEYRFRSGVLKVTFTKDTNKQLGVKDEADDDESYYDKLYDDISCRLVMNEHGLSNSTRLNYKLFIYILHSTSPAKRIIQL